MAAGGVGEEREAEARAERPAAAAGVQAGREHLAAGRCSVTDPDEAEEWRNVAANPGYAVSSLGRVRGVRGGIMRHDIVKGGYHRVRLSGENCRRCLVHVLVAEAFLEPRPDGHQVNHRNGDKDDNSAMNLEYATPSENVRHSLDVLGVKRAAGSRNGWSKLSDAAVLDIRLRRSVGESAASIAASLNVHECTIYRVLSGQYWSHVKEAS